MKKIIVILVFLLLLSAGAFFYFTGQRKTDQQPCYSGTIESTRANLAFQVGGRVVAVYTDEGRQVKKGMLLAELDASGLQSKYQEAAAMLDQSGKNLERLEILLEVFSQTLPADVERARAGVKSALAGFQEAENDKKRFDDLRDKAVISQKDWEAVNLKYESAAARLDEARAVLNQAQSNLKKLELTEKEIQVAKTQQDAAKAAAAFAQIQMDYTRLNAPFDGIISTRNMEPGEVVTQGKEVLTLSEIEIAELKIYVNETDIGNVAYDQTADVRIDTFPDRIFKGRVSFISPEAEFTPKIIQTRKERVKLVYMVKITIPNPEHILKPGMPADACFTLPLNRRTPGS